MMSGPDQKNQFSVSRREILAGSALGILSAPLGFIGAKALPGRSAPATDFSEFPICRASDTTPVLTGAPRKLNFSWNAGAVCLTTIPVAIDQGFFKKQNLDVELVNFAGSTDQLLESLATGKADAAVGMALRWLKPLEQGFDVKITTGLHGGCLRVLTRADSGISKLADLKGKIVGTADLGSPEKNFFSVQLAKQGIDPVSDVDWRPYPGDLLRQAVEKGEVQAFASTDPVAYLWLKDATYKEIASNLDGEYKDRSCCIIGVRGSLVREEPLVARAITQAILDSAAFTAQNPDIAAKSYQAYAPKKASLEDLSAMVHYHTHHHHPVGEELKKELKGYADDLKSVSVIKSSTDTTKFADKIYYDVFTV